MLWAVCDRLFFWGMCGFSVAQARKIWYNVIAVKSILEMILMSNIYLFSGPCGCGKTTLSKAYAEHLVNKAGAKQAYLIHGDDFHSGFVEADEKEKRLENEQDSSYMRWEDILKFNWDCIISVAQKALDKGLDVVIDYVVEDELPLIKNIANKFESNLYYVVLTATEECIKQRIKERGDTELTERALYLKAKLDNMPENQGHLFDNTGMSVEEEIRSLNIEDFRITL